MTEVVLFGLKINGKPLVNGHKSAGYARQPLVGVFINFFHSAKYPPLLGIKVKRSGNNPV
jgi:hypothetical protein